MVSQPEVMRVVVVGRVPRLRRNTHWHKDVSFDSPLLLEMVKGVLGKGGLFVESPVEDDCLTWLTGSSTQVTTCLH